MSDKHKFLLFIILFAFAIVSIFLIFKTSLIFNDDKSITLLSEQFLKGHISLEPNMDLPPGDISIYNGKYYMYFGPLTSLLILPGVLFFGQNFPQITLGFLTIIVSFIIAFKISRHFKFAKVDALWLSLFLICSTVLLSTSIINITSYLVEAIGVPLVLLSLYFYFANKKSFLSGLFMGLAILTRVTLVIAVAFFILEFFQKRLTRGQLLFFLIPVALCCIFLGGYNFIRFHSFIETGYNYHMQEPYPLSKNYEFGRTNLVHIPANLYAFFIKPPVPILDFKDGFVFKFPYLKADPWGMAIWFTSPLFLLLFKFKKNKYTKSALITTILIALPIITYYSVGFAQFGYRYALDFLPFLFLLLIPNIQPKLTKGAIALIVIGVIFNCIYITSLWNVYPHFGIL